MSKALVQVLIDAGIETKPVRYFYDQLAEVQWATESLFNALAEATKDKGGAESIWRDYYAKRIMLAVQTLQQRSEGAHFAGLKALYTLDVTASEVNGALARLKHLEPRGLPDLATLAQLLKQNLAQLESQVAYKKALQEEGQQLLQKELKEFKQVNELLEIRPTDTWNEVVYKAVSLRQFGRITEAMAAFYKYGQMFAPTDPTAEGYANTALAFTQQISALGLQGGVYLYNILEQGAAKEAGIAVGDVIIEYDGKTITRMDDIISALKDSQEGEVKRITYLRLDSTTGRFTRYSGSIKSGPLGAGFMPI